jgi:hypothetical protein
MRYRRVVRYFNSLAREAAMFATTKSQILDLLQLTQPNRNFFQEIEFEPNIKDSVVAVSHPHSNCTGPVQPLLPSIYELTDLVSEGES